MVLASKPLMFIQMLELEDFYLDNLILRQVNRQKAQAAAEMEDDLGEGDDIIVPGTQMKKPQDLESGAEDDMDEERWHSVKKERLSKGLSQARAAGTPESDDDEPELIDMDE
jgi:hypothetical protein